MLNMKKIIIVSAFLFLSQLVFVSGVSAKESETSKLPVITIGLVSDGSIEKSRPGPASVINIFINELEALAKGEFHLRSLTPNI